MNRDDVAETVRLGVRVLTTRLAREQTRGGVAVLMNPRGELLMTLARYRLGWSFPGGYFEPGESGEAGITRELREEVGYPTDGPVIQVVHRSERRTHVEHFGFAMLDQTQADRLHPTSWEIRAARWCSPHSMPPLHTFARSLLSNGEGIVSQQGGRWIPGPAVSDELQTSGTQTTDTQTIDTQTIDTQTNVDQP